MERSGIRLWQHGCVTTLPAPAARSGFRRCAPFFDVAVPGSTFGVGSLPHLQRGRGGRVRRSTGSTSPRCPACRDARRRSRRRPGARRAPGCHARAVRRGRGRLRPARPRGTRHHRPRRCGRFVGLRAFLDEAVRRRHRRAGQVAVHRADQRRARPRRAGAAARRRLPMALRTVRSHLASIRRADRRRRCPKSPQLVVLDEPLAGDLVGTTSRSLPTRRSICCRQRWRSSRASATVGVHACGDADLATLLAAGPQRACRSRRSVTS